VCTVKISSKGYYGGVQYRVMVQLDFQKKYHPEYVRYFPGKYGTLQKYSTGIYIFPYHTFFCTYYSSACLASFLLKIFFSQSQ